MAYDDGTGILLAPFTKIAANGQGDLQRALRRLTCYSEIQLIKDIDGEGNDMERINIFAKYKPFPYNGMWNNDSAGKAARLAANQSTNYALTIPTFTNWSTLITGSPSRFDTKWIYNKPAGTSLQPLRALDFDGYMSHCREWSLDNSTDRVLNSPFGVSISVPGKTVGINDNLTLDYVLGNNALNEYLLYLHDFHTTTLPIKNYYFGILAVNIVNGSPNANNSRLYVSGSRPVDAESASAGGQVNIQGISLSGLSQNSTYTIVPVLCSATRTGGFQGSLPSGATVITLDGYNFPGYTVSSYSVNLNITATFKSQTSTKTIYEIMILNRTNAAIDITDLFMFVEPEYYNDLDFITHQEIVDRTDWSTVDPSDDSSFRTDVIYNGNMVAKYVDIYPTFYSANGNRNRVGTSDSALFFDVEMNVVKDGNNNPFTNGAVVYGWFRYNQTKHSF